MINPYPTLHWFYLFLSFIKNNYLQITWQIKKVICIIKVVVNLLRQFFDSIFVWNISDHNSGSGIKAYLIKADLIWERALVKWLATLLFWILFISKENMHIIFILMRMMITHQWRWVVKNLWSWMMWIVNMIIHCRCIWFLLLIEIFEIILSCRCKRLILIDRKYITPYFSLFLIAFDLINIFNWMVNMVLLCVILMIFLLFSIAESYQILIILLPIMSNTLQLYFI